MSQNLNALEAHLPLTTCEQQQFIDLSCNGSLKCMFDADKLPQFQLVVKNGCPSSSEKVINVLLPFVTTYLCEAELSAVTVTKTKYQL
jgi:hypothetical protein